MATYTTNVSDISKGQVQRAWLIGLVGTLGIHYFRVGKIKAGILRLLIGVLLWGVTITAISEGGSDSVPLIICMVILLVIIALFDFFRIKLGKFSDNAGAYIREP